MIIIKQHIVPFDVQKIRLLDYALQVFTTIPSRSSMKKVIKGGALLVDGKPGHASSWVLEKQQIALVDLETEKTVDRMSFVSKGKNTPFEGKKLKAWPVKTIVQGAVY